VRRCESNGTGASRFRTFALSHFRTGFPLKEPVYEVFARKTREEPLRHIGYVNAMSGDLARVYAWKTYDEQNWIEMCVVPRSAILPVDPEESQFVHDTGPRDSEEEIVHMAGTGSYGGGDVAVKETA